MEPQYLAKGHPMTVTAFPRVKSAGVQGAKVVGKNQMVEVTVKTTNGYQKTQGTDIKVPRTQQGGADIGRSSSLPGK